MRAFSGAAENPNGTDLHSDEDVGLYGSIAALAQKGFLDPETANTASGNGFAFAIIPYDINRDLGSPIFSRTIDDIVAEYRSRKIVVICTKDGDLCASASRLVFVAPAHISTSTSSLPHTQAGPPDVPASRSISGKKEPKHRNFKPATAALFLIIATTLVILILAWIDSCNDSCQRRIAENCATLTNSYSRTGSEFDRCMRRNDVDPVEWRATQRRVGELGRSVEVLEQIPITWNHVVG